MEQRPAAIDFSKGIERKLTVNHPEFLLVDSIAPGKSRQRPKNSHVSQGAFEAKDDPTVAKPFRFESKNSYITEQFREAKEDINFLSKKDINKLRSSYFSSPLATTFVRNEIVAELYDHRHSLAKLVEAEPKISATSLSTKRNDAISKSNKFFYAHEIDSIEVFTAKFGKQIFNDLKSAFQQFEVVSKATSKQSVISDSSGTGTILVRNVLEAFHCMGRNLQQAVFLTLCDKVELLPRDHLSLTQFVCLYAHFFLLDRSISPTINDSFTTYQNVITAPTTETDSLNYQSTAIKSISEIAILYAQDLSWRSASEQKSHLIRSLCTGRSAIEINLITEISNKFEAIDTSNCGEITFENVKTMIKSILASDHYRAAISTSLDPKSASSFIGKIDSVFESLYARIKQQSRSSVFLPEIYEYFGSTIEQLSTSALTISEAFQVLRLRLKVSDLREYLRTVIKAIDSVIIHDTDQRYWRINANNDEFYNKVWRHNGAEQFMRVIGFVKTIDNGLAEGKMRTILSLQSLPSDFSKMTKLPPSIVKSLASKRDELEVQLQSIEGLPSLLQLSRELRNMYALNEIIAAFETLHRILSNILSFPTEKKYEHIRKDNRLFHHSIGRLQQVDQLMSAIGFIGLNEEFDSNNTDAPGSEGQSKQLFILRKKTDLELILKALDEERLFSIQSKANISPSRNSTPINHHPASAPSVNITDAFHSNLSPSKRNKIRSIHQMTLQEKVEYYFIQHKNFLGRYITDVSSAQQSQIRMIVEAFIIMDVDNDSKLSLLDVKSYFRDLGRPHDDFTVLKWIKDRDLNQDGCVSLMEYIASFSNQLDPTNRSFPLCGSASAGTKLIRFEDISPVAIAFGLLRISASNVQEMHNICYSVEQYIKRIVDSPGVATYLVINTTSDQYESTIGRFSGSLEMMKAVGFEYNSEKKLLTLNDHSITVGKISPDFIEVLKGRLKEIQSHHAAIDHTDISNVAAVSAAIGSYGNTHSELVAYADAYEVILKILSNVLKRNTVSPTFKIDTSSDFFAKKFGALPETIRIMKYIGFKDSMKGYFFLPIDSNMNELDARRVELQTGLQFNLRRRYALQYPQEATYSDPVAITIQVEATPSTTVPLHALRSQPPLVNQRSHSSGASKRLRHSKDKDIEETSHAKKNLKLEESYGVGRHVSPINSSENQQASNRHNNSSNINSTSQPQNLSNNQPHQLISEKNKINLSKTPLRSSSRSVLNRREEIEPSISHSVVKSTAKYSRNKDAAESVHTVERRNSKYSPLQSQPHRFQPTSSSSRHQQTILTGAPIAKAVNAITVVLSHDACTGDTQLSVGNNESVVKLMKAVLISEFNFDIVTIQSTLGSNKLIVTPALAHTYSNETIIKIFPNTLLGMRALKRYTDREFIGAIINYDVLPSVIERGDANLMQRHLNKLYAKRPSYRQDLSVTVENCVMIPNHIHSLLSNVAYLIFIQNNQVLSTMNISFAPVELMVLFEKFASSSLNSTSDSITTLNASDCIEASNSCFASDLTYYISQDERLLGVFQSFADYHRFHKWSDLITSITSGDGLIPWMKFQSILHPFQFTQVMNPSDETLPTYTSNLDYNRTLYSLNLLHAGVTGYDLQLLHRLFVLIDSDNDESISLTQMVDAFSQLDGTLEVNSSFGDILNQELGELDSFRKQSNILVKVSFTTFALIREKYCKVVNTPISGLRLNGVIYLDRLLRQEIFQVYKGTDQVLPEWLLSSNYLPLNCSVSQLLEKFQITNDYSILRSTLNGDISHSFISQSINISNKAFTANDIFIIQTIADFANRRLYILTSQGELLTINSETQAILHTECVIYSEGIPSHTYESADQFNKWKASYGLADWAMTNDVSFNSDRVREIQAISSEFSKLLWIVSKSIQNYKVMSIDQLTGMIAINCSLIHGSVLLYEPGTTYRILRLRAPGKCSTYLSDLTQNISTGRSYPSSIYECITYQQCKDLVLEMQIVLPQAALVCTLILSPTIYVLDLFNGQELMALNGHTNAVKCIRFIISDSSNTLLSGDVDGTVRVWPIEALVSKGRSRCCTAFKSTESELEDLIIRTSTTAPGCGVNAQGNGTLSAFRSLWIKLSNALDIKPTWRTGIVTSFFDGMNFMHCRPPTLSFGVEIRRDDSTLTIYSNHVVLRNLKESEKYPSGMPKWTDFPAELEIGVRVATFEIDPNDLIVSCNRHFGLLENQKIQFEKCVEHLQSLLGFTKELPLFEGVQNGSNERIDQARKCHPVQAHFDVAAVLASMNLYNLGTEVTLAEILHQLYYHQEKYVSQANFLLNANSSSIVDIVYLADSNTVATFGQFGDTCLWTYDRTELSVSLFPPFVDATGTRCYEKPPCGSFQLLKKLDITTQLQQKKKEQFPKIYDARQRLTVTSACHQISLSKHSAAMANYPIKASEMLKAFEVDSKFNPAEVTLRTIIYVYLDFSYSAFVVKQFQPSYVTLSNQQDFLAFQNLNAAVKSDFFKNNGASEVFKRKNEIMRIIYTVSCVHLSVQQCIQDLLTYGVVHTGHVVTTSEMLSMVCFERTSSKSITSLCQQVSKLPTVPSTSGMIVSVNDLNVTVALDYSNDIVNIQQGQIIKVLTYNSLEQTYKSSTHNNIESKKSVAPQYKYSGNNFLMQSTNQVSCGVGDVIEFYFDFPRSQQIPTESVEIVTLCVQAFDGEYSFSYIQPLTVQTIVIVQPAYQKVMEHEESHSSIGRVSKLLGKFAGMNTCNTANLDRWIIQYSIQSSLAKQQLVSDSKYDPIVSSVSKRQLSYLLCELCSNRSLTHFAIYNIVTLRLSNRFFVELPLRKILGILGTELLAALDLIKEKDIDVQSVSAFVRAYFNQNQVPFPLIRRFLGSFNSHISLTTNTRECLFSSNELNGFVSLQEVVRCIHSLSLSVVKCMSTSLNTNCIPAHLLPLINRCRNEYSGSLDVKSAYPMDTETIKDIKQAFLYLVRKSVSHCNDVIRAAFVNSSVNLTGDSRAIRTQEITLQHHELPSVQPGSYLIQSRRFWPSCVPNMSIEIVTTATVNDLFEQKSEINRHIDELQSFDGFGVLTMTDRFHDESESKLKSWQYLSELSSKLSMFLPIVDQDITFVPNASFSPYQLISWKNSWQSIQQIINDHGGLLRNHKTELFRIMARSLLNSLILVEQSNLALRFLNPSQIVLDMSSLQLYIIPCPAVCLVSPIFESNHEEDLFITFHDLLVENSYREAVSKSCIPHTVNDPRRFSVCDCLKRWDLWSFGATLFYVAFGFPYDLLSIEKDTLLAMNVYETDGLNIVLYVLIANMSETMRLNSKREADLINKEIIDILVYFRSSQPSLLTHNSLFFDLVEYYCGSSMADLKKFRNGFINESTHCGVTDDIMLKLWDVQINQVYTAIQEGLGQQREISELISKYSTQFRQFTRESVKEFLQKSLNLDLTHEYFDAFISSLAELNSASMNLMPYPEVCLAALKRLDYLLPQIALYCSIAQTIFIIGHCFTMSSKLPNQSFTSLSRYSVFSKLDHLSVFKAKSDCTEYLKPFKSPHHFVEQCVLSNLHSFQRTLNSKARISHHSQLQIETSPILAISTVMSIVEELVYIITFYASRSTPATISKHFGPYMPSSKENIHWLVDNIIPIVQALCDSNVLASISGNVMLYSNQLDYTDEQFNVAMYSMKTGSKCDERDTELYVGSNTNCKDASNNLMPSLQVVVKLLVRLSTFFETIIKHLNEYAKVYSHPLTYVIESDGEYYKNENDYTDFFPSESETEEKSSQRIASVELRAICDYLYVQVIDSLIALCLNDAAILSFDNLPQHHIYQPIWRPAQYQLFEAILAQLVDERGKGCNSIAVTNLANASRYSTNSVTQFTKTHSWNFKDTYYFQTFYRLMKNFVIIYQTKNNAVYEKIIKSTVVQLHSIVTTKSIAVDSKLNSKCNVSNFATSDAQTTQHISALVHCNFGSRLLKVIECSRTSYVARIHALNLCNQMLFYIQSLSDEFRQVSPFCELRKQLVSPDWVNYALHILQSRPIANLLLFHTACEYMYTMSKQFESMMSWDSANVIISLSKIALMTQSKELEKSKDIVASAICNYFQLFPESSTRFIALREIKMTSLKTVRNINQIKVYLSEAQDLSIGSTLTEQLDFSAGVKSFIDAVLPFFNNLLSRSDLNSRCRPTYEEHVRVISDENWTRIFEIACLFSTWVSRLCQSMSVIDNKFTSNSRIQLATATIQNLLWTIERLILYGLYAGLENSTACVIRCFFGGTFTDQKQNDSPAEPMLESICQQSFQGSFINPLSSLLLQSRAVWVMIRVLRSAKQNGHISLLSSLHDCNLIRFITHYQETLFSCLSNPRRLAKLYRNTNDFNCVIHTTKSMWDCIYSVNSEEFIFDVIRERLLDKVVGSWLTCTTSNSKAAFSNCNPFVIRSLAVYILDSTLMWLKKRNNTSSNCISPDSDIDKLSEANRMLANELSHALTVNRTISCELSNLKVLQDSRNQSEAISPNASTVVWTRLLASELLCSFTSLKQLFIEYQSVGAPPILILSKSCYESVATMSNDKTGSMLKDWIVWGKQSLDENDNHDTLFGFSDKDDKTVQQIEDVLLNNAKYIRLNDILNGINTSIEFNGGDSDNEMDKYDNDDDLNNSIADQNNYLIDPCINPSNIAARHSIDSSETSSKSLRLSQQYVDNEFILVATNTSTNAVTNAESIVVRFLPTESKPSPNKLFERIGYIINKVHAAYMNYTPAATDQNNGAFVSMNVRDVQGLMEHLKLPNIRFENSLQIANFEDFIQFYAYNAGLAIERFGFDDPSYRDGCPVTCFVPTEKGIWTQIPPSRYEVVCRAAQPYALKPHQVEQLLPSEPFPSSNQIYQTGYNVASCSHTLFIVFGDLEDVLTLSGLNVSAPMVNEAVDKLRPFLSITSNESQIHLQQLLAIYNYCFHHFNNESKSEYRALLPYRQNYSLENSFSGISTETKSEPANSTSGAYRSYAVPGVNSTGWLLPTHELANTSLTCEDINREFDHLDIVGEGKLYYTNLKTSLELRDVHFGDEELKAWIVSYDRATKGYVNRDDYLAIYKNASRLSGTVSTEDRAVYESTGELIVRQGSQKENCTENKIDVRNDVECQLRRAFNLYDVDGDGFISVIDLQQSFASTGKKYSIVHLQEWIRQRDISKHGKVSFHDFASHFCEALISNV